MGDIKESEIIAEMNHRETLMMILQPLSAFNYYRMCEQINDLSKGENSKWKLSITDES